MIIQNKLYDSFDQLDIAIENTLEHERAAIRRHGIEARNKKLIRKRTGFLHTLSKFGSAGKFLIYAMMAISFRKRSFSRFKNIIILDHRSGLIQKELQKLDQDTNGVIRESIRIPISFFLSFQLIKLFIKCIKHHKLSSQLELQSVVEFVLDVFSKSFILSTYPGYNVIMVDDFTPQRLAWGLTSQMFECKTSIVRLSSEEGRDFPFFNFDQCYVWSQKQYQECVLRNKEAKVFALEFDEVIPPDLAFDESEAALGLALSGITGQQEIERTISEIEQYSVTKKVVIKEHPRNDLDYSFVSQFSVEIEVVADWTDFMTKVDYAFCGLSSAILLLLRSGMPVVYLGELDDPGYDLSETKVYNFIFDGLVLNYDSQFDIKKLKTYYSSGTWKNIFSEYYETPHNVDSFQKGIQLLYT